MNVILGISRKTSLQKAIDWVKKNKVPHSGIAVHHKTKLVTPEVTGYLIASLYDADEKAFATDLAEWEISIQQSDGSFLAPDGVPYTFDTAQVMRGWLKFVDDLPEVKHHLRRAADFVASQIDDKGEVKTPSYDTWKLSDGSMFSRYCDLYVLPPLREAGKYFREPRYLAAADRALNRFKEHKDLTEFKPQLGTLSHIFGYMMEALAELEEFELAKKGLSQVEAIQKADGSIPAYPGVEWVCSPGIAQLGLAWFKVGNIKRARKAYQYLESIQNSSGGFYASFGKGAQYLPYKEVCWANKFFIDLSLLLKNHDSSVFYDTPQSTI